MPEWDNKMKDECSKNFIIPMLNEITKKLKNIERKLDIMNDKAYGITNSEWLKDNFTFGDNYDETN